MKIKTTRLFVLLGLMTLIPGLSHAEGKYNKSHKAFFKGGFSTLMTSRGGEVFTDTNGASGVSNDSKGGFSVTAGLDLGMMDPASVMNTFSLVGEIRAEFSRFSNQVVRQTTSALLGGVANRAVNVTELNVSVSPKIRFDTLGRFKPYIVPVGLSFLVVSPPSNDSTYLDIGINTGAGLDIMILEWLSAGIDLRYTHGFELNHTSSSYFSASGGFGVHF